MFNNIKQLTIELTFMFCARFGKLCFSKLFSIIILFFLHPIFIIYFCLLFLAISLCVCAISLKYNSLNSLTDNPNHCQFVTANLLCESRRLQNRLAVCAECSLTISNEEHRPTVLKMPNNTLFIDAAHQV